MDKTLRRFPSISLSLLIVFNLLLVVCVHTPQGFTPDTDEIFAQILPPIMQAPPAAGAPVVSQSASCASAVASTCTATLSVALPAGHRLLVMVGSNSSVNIPTMTGETFTAFTGTSGCLDNTGDVIQCWMIQSAAGGQTAVNCSASLTNLLCGAIDITAPTGNTPKDVGGHGNNAGATSFTVSSSAASTNANDLAIGCFYSAPATTSNVFVVGSPYASVLNFTSPASGGGQMMCEQNTPGSTGTQTATATIGTSVRAAYFVMAIKP